ncbi:hypothetical protein [Pseudonocardia xishanensis]|uniref:PIN domain-containing protein n=1 Tax=Pseudonocardia xishanensis TaxID=630995 RepID=A0ABP8RC32_9PSEU
MQRIILDTDVASQVIERRVPAPLAQELAGAKHGITFITYGELTRWSIMSQWGTARRGSLDAWLTARPTLPYTDDVARIWGEITATPPAAAAHAPRTTAGSPPPASPTTSPSRR